jgi:hypothetical protein
MLRSCAFVKCAAVLFAVASCLALRQLVVAQAPAAKLAGANAEPISRTTLLKTVELSIPTKPLHDKGPMSLKEFLGLLEETVKSNHGKELPMQLDSEAFRAINPDAPEVAETMIHFPTFPQSMWVGTALRVALSKVETKNATYIVMPDRILITANEWTTPEAKLQEKVRGTYDKRPLYSILAEISETLVTTIMIDNRAVDKAKTEISATFLTEVDLAAALRVLTEMADLKVVALDGVIFVTTPAHADALRKEHLQRMMEIDKVRELKEKVPLKSSGFPNLPGEFKSRALQVDPLWPYLPQVHWLHYPRVD